MTRPEPGEVVELDDLGPAARALLERLLAADSVVVTQSGRARGELRSHAVAHDVPGPREADVHREGVKVLAVTMDLKPEARERLRRAFGPEWVVLDFHDAPETADVVLTAAHSPQLIHRWTLMFPQAQVIITEILDAELRLDVSGPVGRLMDAGADAYLPPRPLEQVARNVQTYLEGRARAAITASEAPAQSIGS
jgi:hypothetical protein